MSLFESTSISLLAPGSLRNIKQVAIVMVASRRAASLSSAPLWVIMSTSTTEHAPVCPKQRCLFPWGHLHAIWYMIPWVHPSLHPKRHLSRGSCFSRAHDRDQQTEKHTERQTTDHATPYVTIVTSMLSMRCGLIIPVYGCLVHLIP